MAILSRAICEAGSRILLPLVCAKAIYSSDWRASLGERLGRGDWGKIQPHLGPQIWFHAASVGEVGGLSPVFEAIQKDFKELNTLVTTTSLTGKAEVIKRRLANASCLLPLDHPRMIARVLGRIDPKFLVITETELWPNLIYALRDRNIPIVIINGRISDYSFPCYRKLRGLIKPIFGSIDHIIAQTALDRLRYIELGADEEKVEVGGCTKYDRPRTEFSEWQLNELFVHLGFERSKPVFVAGSIRAEEDKQVIDAFIRSRKTYPDLQAIFAPRHPESYEQVAEYLRQQGISFWRRSAGAAQAQNSVVLLDTMGELAKMYAASTFSFVGGSLVDIGGHNPLEPAAYAKAVLMGPYHSVVREVVSDLKAASGMIEVKDGNDLYRQMVKLVSDNTYCSSIGKNAEIVWRNNQGATRRVVALIKNMLLREGGSSF